MTNINTIIEDENANLKDWHKQLHTEESGWDEDVDNFEWWISKTFTTAMQRAYEAGRISWLRSEIEKLEAKHEQWFPHPIRQADGIANYDYNMGVLDTLSYIITRYKEELLELEKGV